ncbi:LuxR C-terminal-related transcriptional regulator [Accumulibacter sp.]|uniref:response regulator transcription factor n=1 Tax=Accumulibacter sp. TaxID=2053492 RepID=UPI0025D70F57|nr:LuxR C-terminal-related transcriptional regulator [Accumulibacter sp.]MCM8596889.1 LuxR C-terminal-related transcriptional regulator [Accumulibacter sp.]MCM8624577.1 LuxR C-terminal-related transcriptional regulator [Accumulibacter sp.]MDS4051037.1 LuxR C-terminal-related transcriptional regulator [Accumulibacter sp.]
MSMDAEESDGRESGSPEQSEETAPLPLALSRRRWPGPSLRQVVSDCLAGLEPLRAVAQRRRLAVLRGDDPLAGATLAASDPVVRLFPGERSARPAAPTRNHPAVVPLPFGERRRAERRQVARRSEDGDPGHWRSVDRRQGERRAWPAVDRLDEGLGQRPEATGANRSRRDGAIPVLVASQRKDLVAGIGVRLAAEGGIDFAGASPDALADVAGLVRRSSAEVVLVDTALLALLGVGCLDQARKANGRAKLLLLWDEAYPVPIDDIERNSVCGCIPLFASARHYARAIREVSQGGLWLPRWMMSQICQRILVRGLVKDQAGGERPVPLSPLTAREAAIARRAAAGQTNKEIALELNVSPDTVKKHLGAVFNKVGVRRRSQLAYAVALLDDEKPG